MPVRCHSHTTCHKSRHKYSSTGTHHLRQRILENNFYILMAENFRELFFYSFPPLASEFTHIYNSGTSSQLWIVLPATHSGFIYTQYNVVTIP